MVNEEPRYIELMMMKSVYLYCEQANKCAKVQCERSVLRAGDGMDGCGGQCRVRRGQSDVAVEGCEGQRPAGRVVVGDR